MLSADIFQFTPRTSYGEFVSAANIRVTFKQTTKKEGQQIDLSTLKKIQICSCNHHVMQFEYKKRLLE